ncbi:MAG: HU family DNA-binding protein [Actinomycetota bacterium]|nr:HU family DNA-binding protein [Actinomycetota bacterium]
MNKAELIERVADVTGEAKSRTSEFVDATLGAVESALAKGDRVVLPGFGTFTARPRKARTGRNPQTGAAVKIAATTVPVFKAGQALKAIVSGKTKISATKTKSKKAPAKKSPAKSAAKKSPAKKSPAKKSAARKSTAKKAPAKKTAAKKSTAKKSSAKRR